MSVVLRIYVCWKAGNLDIYKRISVYKELCFGSLFVKASLLFVCFCSVCYFMIHLDSIYFITLPWTLFCTVNCTRMYIGTIHDIQVSQHWNWNFEDQYSIQVSCSLSFWPVNIHCCDTIMKFTRITRIVYILHCILCTLAFL